MNSIESNLKSICRQKGLSLTDVANRMGTSPSNLLSSVKGNPTISKIQDIAKALQVSVSELLALHPDKAQGVAFINGTAFQLSKPSFSTVQLPIHDRYDTLREEIKDFIKKCVEGSEHASKMGLVETMEVFSLVYDPDGAKFFLSLCYADGKTLTNAYDKFEYCNWDKSKAEDDAPWDLACITEEIINDLEGWVPQKLKSE